MTYTASDMFTSKLPAGMVQIPGMPIGPGRSGIKEQPERSRVISKYSRVLPIVLPAIPVTLIAHLPDHILESLVVCGHPISFAPDLFAGRHICYFHKAGRFNVNLSNTECG